LLAESSQSTSEKEDVDSNNLMYIISLEAIVPFQVVSENLFSNFPDFFFKYLAT